MIRHFLIALAMTAMAAFGAEPDDAPDLTRKIARAEEMLPKVEKFSEDYEHILEFLGAAYMELEDNANMNRILGLMEEHNQHELMKECNDPECHLKRAEYYYTMGDPAHAKDEFAAAFAMPLSPKQKAQACREYAKFLGQERDFAQGGDYYVMSADAMVEDKGDVTELSTLMVRQAGLYYFIGNEYAKSIEAHKRAIAEVDKYGFDQKYKSISLQGLGNAYKANKEYDNAIAAFKNWIAYLKSNGQEGEEDYAKAHESLAQAEKSKGDFDASIADYNVAIDLYGKLGLHDKQQDASNGLKLCLAYARKDAGDIPDDSAKALEERNNKLREIIRSSINTLEQGGDYLGKFSTAQTYATIAGSYALLGDYTNAIDYYEKYIAAIRPALAEAFILKNPKERELTWAHELNNIVEMSALITELPQGTPELYARLSTLIYEGQLLSKGILLSSNIEFDKILSRYGTKEMAAQYEAIKSNLAKIEKIKEQSAPMEETLKLERETDAMQLALARESAKYGIYTDFLNITAKDIFAALTPDDVAVEFVTLASGVLPSENMVAAVLISREMPGGITLPIGSVAQIKAIIDDPDKFASDEYAAAIWGSILQLSQGKKRIFFSPDGLLNNVGIEYLTIGGEQISDYVELHRLSSTREIVRKHPEQPLRQVALFGDIDYSDVGTSEAEERKSVGQKFARLKNAGREVQEISQILQKDIDKSHIALYTGANAGKKEFLSQTDTPVNLLHISTHGAYMDQKGASDADAMARSILALAGANRYPRNTLNDGVISAAEIAEMALQQCDLAVLSACETGLGKIGNDGVFGLQRGFKNAGVKSLLVSLNPVADAVTADMMIAFYRHLLDGTGNTKRQALQKAQADIRAQYPGDTTWASFILIDSFR